MSDESFFEQVQAEQRILDAEAPPPDPSRLVHLAAAQAISAALVYALMVFQSILPQNDDGSVQAEYGVLTLLVVSAIAAYLLKSRKLQQPAFRYVCWFFLILSAVGIPVIVWSELAG